MAENVAPFQTDTPISFPLYVCTKEIIRQYSVYLDEFNLTYTQYIAMRAIWAKKEISVSELGKELYLDSGTLTPLLKKLEAKGFVSRTRSKEDERKVIITVTKKGATLQQKVAHIPSLIMKNVNPGDNDIQTLRDLISRKYSSLQIFTGLLQRASV